MSIDSKLTFSLRDEYKRKPIAEKIIQLLNSDVDVSPLIIDGGWGTGKTEFCCKLINLIDEKNNEEAGQSDVNKINLRAIYVDAFKADHADEPLMTLLAAVLTLLPEKEQETLKQKALPALRFGVKTTAKAAISWFLKQDVADIADDFDSDLKKAGDEIVNSTISSMLDDHVKADESIDTLKNALIELTKDNPITIFVDELDRCRPDFAISMLENIKHIFDVDGVQFVLVVNNDQLTSSINHCYGIDDLNAKRYLDKFIAFKLIISNVVDESMQRPVYVSNEHFLNLIKARSTFNGSVLDVKNTGVYREIYEIIKINQLSLREVETFIRYLEIFHTISNGNSLNGRSFGYKLVEIIGVYMYCFKPSVFYGSDIDIYSVIDVIGQDRTIDLNLDFKKYTVSPLGMIAASLILEDKYYDQFNQENEKIEKWRNQISRLYQGGFGYEGDAIETLKNVAAVMSFKT